MFAREHKQEYDPTSTPIIERPLASGRPLSVQIQGSAFGTKGVEGLQKDHLDEKSRIPFYSPARSPVKVNSIFEPQKSPNRAQISPGKSSLSRQSRYTQAQAFNPENGIWSEDEEVFAEQDVSPGKSPRHVKSVTFDAAPPQINEYEMTTPVPSSIASGSRDGSYDSADGEEDESFDRDSSLDRDESFDASLEDTDKTPVVLPEDWRFMSPSIANDDLAASVEDPFEGKRTSPAPTVKPTAASETRLLPTRTDSTSSTGERRPLPPLPALGMPMFLRARSDSNNSLSATAERISSSQRLLPSPPRPASISKSEIQGMGGCSMSIEDRLRLMMSQENEKPKTLAEEQRERRLRRAGARERSEECGDDDKGLAIKVHEEELENEDLVDLGDYKLPPIISRESILRTVKSHAEQSRDVESDYMSPSPGSSPDRLQINDIDPDTPLPSLEDRSNIEEADESIVIKQEDDSEGSEVDVYAIPEMYNHNVQAEFSTAATEACQAPNMDFNRPVNEQDDDDASHYSNDSIDELRLEPQSNSATEDEGPLTPRAQSPSRTGTDLGRKTSNRMSLPQFASMLGDDGFGLGLQPFMTPSPPLSEEPTKKQPQGEPARVEESLQRTITPEEQLFPPTFSGYGNDDVEEPKTPESVIRHHISAPPLPESPGIPEPVATIKAPGGKLKTRPSISPADMIAMAETRRQVSAQRPMVPPIPECHQGLPSLSNESEPLREEPSRSASSAESDVSVGHPDKQVKRKSSLVQLEIPIKEMDEGLSFGLDREFDRVMETQKVAFALSFPNMEPFPTSHGYAEYMPGQGFRPIPENVANRPIRTQRGYLMRQNTKMVVASSASHDSASDSVDILQPYNRGTRSAGNSPRKTSQTRTWTTEPWNGKTRRKSIRQPSSSPQKKQAGGPVPPMPGQPSNASSALDRVAEDDVAPSGEEVEDGVERGRLFVKVVGVKELDLPLPKGKSIKNKMELIRMLNIYIGERSYFALTLDNGLHCVTTSWLELGKYAPIGQEFELVVLNELEFQLTLQTKLEEPKILPMIESPTKTPKVPKPSTFSRVFASPRKRKELEMKQHEDEQRAAKQKQFDVQASRRAAQPTAWDLLHRLVAKDGTFARSYVCLKDHESSAYGRPYTVDVPCFNEWATEEVQNNSSVKSKKGTAVSGMQRKAPYRIGKLELQLLFVPKPKDGNEEDMPKSMNACVRELQEAETSISKTWEGYLSQQGGDCPVSR